MKTKIHDPYIDDYPVVMAWAKKQYPAINWTAVVELAGMLNAELWHGPLPDNYWTECDPRDTPWPGWQQASKQLVAMLNDLPHKVWVDEDCDFVTSKDPNQDENNWSEEDGWIGSDNWWELDLRKVLVPIEVWRHLW